MPLDPELESAIRTVVADTKQPPAVAQRLIAWLKDLSEAEIGLEDKSRHLDNVRSALKLSETPDED